MLLLLLPRLLIHEVQQFYPLHNVCKLCDFHDLVLELGQDKAHLSQPKSYQAVIDKYSELNDTLNDSNSSILNAL